MNDSHPPSIMSDELASDILQRLVANAHNIGFVSAGSGTVVEQPLEQHRDMPPFCYRDAGHMGPEQLVGLLTLKIIRLATGAGVATGPTPTWLPAPVTREPDDEIIHMLECLLDSANAGEIHSFFIAYVLYGGRVFFEVAGPIRDELAAIGVLEAMKAHALSLLMGG